MTPVIKSQGLCRNYVVGTETVHALRDGVISSDAPTKHEVMA